jgi:aarF domain-containing kinase
MKKTGKIPQTALGRSLKILGGGASLLAKEIVGRVSGNPLAAKLKQAQSLVDTLGDLKGAAMKAGQLLSLEASDLLPPEVVEILRQLHDSAPAMSFAQVEKILRRELGEAGFARLSAISPEPVAAASIGQVHSAFVDGRKVAIKVQYPGVASSIDTDLDMLKKFAAGLLTIQGKAIPLDELFEELKRGLKGEVDYRRELESLQAYREAFAGDARYYVPAPLPELCSGHVLTLEFVEGIKLGQWLKQGLSEEDRKDFASVVIGLLVKEFYETGLVQTDPNYGNFLYRPAQRQIVLLDFGATHTYQKQFRRDYRRLLQAAYAGDDAEVLVRAEKLFSLDPREKPATRAMFLELMRLSIRMFQEAYQPVRFDDDEYIDELRRITLEFVKSVEFSPPPKDLVFLNRKLGGMFHLLKDAHCEVDLHPSWIYVQSLEI